MSHKQEVEQQDGLKHHLTTSSSSLGQQNWPMDPVGGSQLDCASKNFISDLFS
jgi:hypothetical protein